MHLAAVYLSLACELEPGPALQLFAPTPAVHARDSRSTRTPSPGGPRRQYISISSIATNTESYKTPTTHAVAQAQPSSSSSGVTVGGSATTSSTRRAARHRATPKKTSDVRK